MYGVGRHSDARNACSAALQVSKAEYVQHGSPALGLKLAKQLRSDGKNPYLIPVGGSNALGCWGYMMALEEIRQQTQSQQPFTHICMVRGRLPLATTPRPSWSQHKCFRAGDLRRIASAQGSTCMHTVRVWLWCSMDFAWLFSGLFL